MVDMRGRRWRCGFTLIELLVVIAIIAVLAGICFPVYAKAREKGRTAACQSNLRQLAMAMHMYATDWDCSCMCCPAGQFSPWWENIQPYINSKAIIRCPSDTGLRALQAFPRLSTAKSLSKTTARRLASRPCGPATATTAG
jgi:prepilin-type N-terminal cleavage/methylation domain-containing protein